MRMPVLVLAAVHAAAISVLLTGGGGGGAAAVDSTARPGGGSARSPACPGPDPTRHCDCSWTHGGKSCGGKDDGSECFCRCCCAHLPAGHTCKWHDPHPGPPPTPPGPPGPPPPTPTPPGPPPPPPPPPVPGRNLTAVRVKGNHLVDAAGNLVVLRGVSHSGSEYTCTHAGGAIFEGKIDSAFVAGLQSWPNLNAVWLSRLCLRCHSLAGRALQPL